jgi:hypothetical protein
MEIVFVCVIDANQSAGSERILDVTARVPRPQKNVKPLESVNRDAIDEADGETANYNGSLQYR